MHILVLFNVPTVTKIAVRNLRILQTNVYDLNNSPNFKHYRGGICMMMHERTDDNADGVKPQSVSVTPRCQSSLSPFPPLSSLMKYRGGLTGFTLPD